MYISLLYLHSFLCQQIKKKRSSALVQHTCILRTKIISYLKGHGLYDLCKYADSFYTAEVQKSFKQYIYIHQHMECFCAIKSTCISYPMVNDP